MRDWLFIMLMFVCLIVALDALLSNFGVALIAQALQAVGL